MPRFEILPQLPVYGPMYIPISHTGLAFYAEGYVVKFYKNNGEEWVANFQLGWTNCSGVYQLGKEDVFLVLAYGAAYVIDPNQTIPLLIFGVDIIEYVFSEVYGFVFARGTNICILGNNKELWHSERISWDGIKELRVSGDIVTALSYDPMDDRDEWVPFTLDLLTRTIDGGSYIRYNRVKQKKWWQLWKK
jgi:hypothetical protein